MAPAVRHGSLLSKEALSCVSRTRCSAFSAAPQSRDSRKAVTPDQQRTTPQARRVAQHPGHLLLRLPTAHRRHDDLVAAAGAAIDFLAGTELQILAHADTHFAEPRLVAGHRDR